MKYLLKMALLLMLISSCSTWILIDKTYIWKSERISIELNSPWAKFNRGSFSITKGGFYLNYISIDKIELKDAGADTTIIYDNSMTLTEINDVMINYYKSNPDYENVKIEKNSLETVDSYAAFQIVLAVTAKNNLKEKIALTAFKKDIYLYIIYYKALSRYYFDKDFSDYQHIVKSFKFLKESEIPIKKRI